MTLEGQADSIQLFHGDRGFSPGAQGLLVHSCHTTSETNMHLVSDHFSDLQMCHHKIGPAEGAVTLTTAADTKLEQFINMQIPSLVNTGVSKYQLISTNTLPPH